MTQDLFASLPAEISLSILSRLPTIYLALAKCVCKAWYDLASHFDIEKLSKNPCFVLHSNKIPDELYIINGNDLIEIDRKGASKTRPIIKFKVPFMREGYKVDSLLSCNGLLLISYSMRKNSKFIQKVSVYNPLIKKFRRLPESNPLLFGQDFECSYGFGFDSNTKQYKVVRVLQRAKSSEDISKGDRQFFYVFTLGSSKDWRLVNNGRFSIRMNQQGVYVDGTLNWNGSWMDDKCIVSFDLLDEVFSSYSEPDWFYSCGLAVFGGRLSAFTVFDGDLDIWSMSKNGGEESWDKTFGVACRYGSFALLSQQNGNLFLMEAEQSYNTTTRKREVGYGYQTIDCYDPATYSYKYLVVKDLPFHPQRATTLVIGLVWPFV